jgi:negative regulator of sigma E activity
MMSPDEMPDDETIAAWLDGALDAEGAQRMTDLAAHDEAFARRAARLNHLDDLVRAAVPAEPEIPAALLERLGLAPDAPAGASVVDIADARQARAARNAAAPVPARQGRGAFFRIAAQVALIAGLGLAVVVISRPGERAAYPAADFGALGTAPDAAAREANALVKFAPGVAADEAGRIAGASGLRLLGKPNAAGAWKAAIAPGRRAAALAALRGDGRVMMAEPIDGAAQ